MKYKEVFATAPHEILANDHFVAVPYTVSATGIEADADGKKVVPAGTILPANDATAKGVLLYDTDVGDGDRSAALVIHGFIKAAGLPAAPATEAVTALKQISFLS